MNPLFDETTRHGVYVELESQKGATLDVTKLEMRKREIEVVASSRSTEDDTQRATLFVPPGQAEAVRQRIDEYTTSEDRGDRPSSVQTAFDPVASVRPATVRSLWTDSHATFPEDPTKQLWWEVWLRSAPAGAVNRFEAIAARVRVYVRRPSIRFFERDVVLAFGTVEQLTHILDVFDQLAELRRPAEMSSFFHELLGHESVEWGEHLLARVQPPAMDAPAVCLLDANVARSHPLIAVALAEEDCHSVVPESGAIPASDSHGTEMAGIALYGDLAQHLSTRSPVALSHRLESVCVFHSRPIAAHKRDADELQKRWCDTTIDAVHRVERVERDRCFSLAVSAKSQCEIGRPSAWSALLDALSFGREMSVTRGGETCSTQRRPRLMIVAAGNIRSWPRAQLDHYLDLCDTTTVFDPAQSWNALTVGAFTDRTVSTAGPSSRVVRSVAAVGELSPFSATGVGFDREWPVKPEVVFEGGNLGFNDSDDLVHDDPTLGVLTTYGRPNSHWFTTFNATSAATAQAAHVAAKIMEDDRARWPETVRALMVHSARWTPAMLRRLDLAQSAAEKQAFLRRYGFGVPSLERALRSTRNEVTLIKEATIRPYSKGREAQMHDYELPWPKSLLYSMDARVVRLRVTLSYFIEPNPSRRGQSSRGRYASHRLRFVVKPPLMTRDAFLVNVNKEMLGDGVRPASTRERWQLGARLRHAGSIASDVLECTPAELAERNVIAVHPLSGWWKDTRDLHRPREVRYSLLVSLECDDADVDLWSAISQQLRVVTEVES